MPWSGANPDQLHGDAQLRDPNDDLVLEVAANGQGLGQKVNSLAFATFHFKHAHLASRCGPRSSFFKEHDMGTQSNYALRLTMR